MQYLKNSTHSGFTLIQVSIMMTVAALMFVAVLPGQQTTLKANANSTDTLNYVMNALRQYQTANGRLPCPADASQPTGSSNYGLAAANPGTVTNCTGGTPAANFVDAVNNVAIGAVPFKALGLSNSYALDGYGREITYAVDTSATTCATTTSLTGKITVTDNGNAVTTVAALVSHGNDGHGAWLPRAGSSGTAVRLNAGSTDSDQLTNAHLSNSFIATATLNNFVRKAPTSTFDDNVVYANNKWNMNSLPLFMQSVLTISRPDNGTYSSGTLVFTVTYPNAVTVTGTPQLPLSAITGSIGTGNVGYATYTSGSGTNKLTFTYTILGTDAAPAGLKMASYINLNGGTISACPLTFIAPDLTQVIIAPVQYIYIAQYDQYVVRKYDLSGNLKLTIGTGTSGSSVSKLKYPMYAMSDSSGNIWVLDAGNQRVLKYNSSGAWQLTIGGSLSQACSGKVNGSSCTNLPGHSACCLPTATSCTCSYGNANGEFNFLNSSAPGMTFDSNGYLWVGDNNSNNRMQQFDPNTGAYMSQFSITNPNTPLLNITNGNIFVTDLYDCVINQCTTAGNCTTYTSYFPNGCHSETDYMAIDLTGNIWITDEATNTVHKYNSSMVYQSDFSFPYSNIEGMAFDNTGNMWLAGYGNGKVYKFDSNGNTLLSVSVTDPVGIYIGK